MGCSRRSAPPAAGRCVVGHVLQVDPDAVPDRTAARASRRPGRRSAASSRRGPRVTRPPDVQGCHRLVAGLGAGDLDQSACVPFGAFSAGPSSSASRSSPSSRPDRVVHALPRVTASANRPGTVATVNVLGPAAGHLVPRAAASTPGRPGVDRTEYAEATVRSLAFWLKSTNTPWRSSFHHRLVASSGARRSTSRATVSAASRTCWNGQLRRDAGVDVEAARPRRLGPGGQPVVLEHLASHQRDVDDLRPVHAGHRVEVDPQFVGVVEVVGAHRVRVEVDAAEVDRPHQAGRRRGAPPPWPRCPDAYLQLGDVDPVRPLLGGALLEDRLLGDALDEPFEDHRPVGDAAQRAVGHREVVVDQVQLGDVPVGPGKTTLSGWVIGTSRPPDVHDSPAMGAMVVALCIPTRPVRRASHRVAACRSLTRSARAGSGQSCSSIAERGSAELHYAQQDVRGRRAASSSRRRTSSAMVADIRRWGEIGMMPALNARRTPNRAGGHRRRRRDDLQRTRRRRQRGGQRTAGDGCQGRRRGRHPGPQPPLVPDRPLRLPPASARA